MGRPGRGGGSSRSLTSLGQLGEVLPCLGSPIDGLSWREGMGGAFAVPYRSPTVTVEDGSQQSSSAECCTHKISAHPQPTSVCPLLPILSSLSLSLFPSLSRRITSFTASIAIRPTLQWKSDIQCCKWCSKTKPCPPCFYAKQSLIGEKKVLAASHRQRHPLN